MSYDTRNPFGISTAWSQGTANGYGPYEWSEPWLTPSKNGSNFATVTGPSGVAVFAQLTSIGGSGVPELYNFTSTEDLNMGGHKFWNDAQNYTASVDEALAIQNSGGEFVCKGKRQPSSFVVSTNSRAIMFACKL